MYDCREDEFAIYFLKQVITDFVTKIVVDALIALVKKLIAKVKNITNQSWKEEYELSDQVVGLLYFQLQLWLGQIFFPFITIIGLIFMYLLFRYSYFSLRVFKAKPRQSSNSSVSLPHPLTPYVGHRLLHHAPAEPDPRGNLSDHRLPHVLPPEPLKMALVRNLTGKREVTD